MALSLNDGTPRWRGCTRKHKYATEAHALEVARSKFEQRRQRLKTYKCQFCGCWHLATDKSLRRRA